MFFGLCGNPVAHSISPSVFKAAYQGRYDYRLFCTSQPQEVLSLFEDPCLMGVNLTAPLKSSVLALLSQKSPECEQSGACNLILKENTGLKAYNTDIEGVKNSLKEIGIDLSGLRVLLLGAGGAAKAAAYALYGAGARVVWANRHPQHIPERFCGQTTETIALSQAAQITAHCSLIINTLPQPCPETAALSILSRHTVFDASYATRPLEDQAKQTGARYIGGERWWLHQALPAFTLFTGERPSRADMEQILQIELQEPK
jgi:Shikimate 5-dehydrogenase